VTKSGLAPGAVAASLPLPDYLGVAQRLAVFSNMTGGWAVRTELANLPGSVC
jgi:hypothetical protein